MRRLLFVLSAVFLTVPVFAQEPAPSVEKNRFVLHPEPFATFGTSSFERTVLDDGEPPGRFTVSIAYQLGLGSRRWVTCDPNTDPECTEANAPRFAFGGIGAAWAPNGGVGGWGVQFPLVTLRIVRNAWVGTAVTVWPWAPEGRRNVSFTYGLSLALGP